MSVNRIYKRNQFEQATGSRTQPREEIETIGFLGMKNIKVVNYIPAAVLSEEKSRKKKLADKAKKK